VRALLDVSVLLPLFDPEHVHHERARAWWDEQGGNGWASCPLTQNGFVRVISSSGYGHPLLIGAALSILDAQLREPGHEFWPDDLSLMDSQVFDHSRIVGPRQITDVYLLALAVKHGGRLVTLDQAIPLAAVRQASPRHLVAI
jgi:toxin-antitoxin system PIN domain toxin